MPTSDAQSALAAALDRLWVQFLPQIRERIEILEKSAQAFAAGRLTMEQHELASAAAHKLAGCWNFRLHAWHGAGTRTGDRVRAGYRSQSRVGSTANGCRRGVARDDRFT